MTNLIEKTKIKDYQTISRMKKVDIVLHYVGIGLATLLTKSYICS
jgi:hypothetical protein